jgi:hypothetical protein
MDGVGEAQKMGRDILHAQILVHHYGAAMNNARCPIRAIS